MSKPLIVIADMDENYLTALENKILEQLNDNVDLEIISSVKYFQDFFSKPQTVEIVAVDEKMYNKDLEKHNINNMFIFSEHPDNNGLDESSVKYIFKYTGIKEIIHELLYKSESLWKDSPKQKEGTKIISFYSAIGGSGKTALSIGLAACLAQKHYRVLYINTESIQDFSFYLNDQTYVSNIYRAIRENRKDLYKGIKYMLKKEEFSYLPPFNATLDVVNLDYGIYLSLIKTAQEDKEFDYIIVDVEAGYEPERLSIINNSDKVVITTMQDAVSLYKTSYLTRNFDFQNKDKYLFICNKFQNELENCYFSEQSTFQIDEYIELAEMPLKKVHDLLEIEGIQRLAYAFI